MSDDKAEGKEKICGACKEALICVKVVSTWNNKTEEKLQWQTKSTGKPHFKYAGPNNWKCILPIPEDIVQASMEDHAEVDAKEEIEVQTSKPGQVKVNGPFEEAEIIARWASERAYKIAMADVESVSHLSPQQVSALGQKTGMLTRLIADTTIELMKIHGIKTDYGKQD